MIEVLSDCPSVLDERLCSSYVKSEQNLAGHPVEVAVEVLSAQSFRSTDFNSAHRGSRSKTRDHLT